jgi:hypothetical protein
MTHKKIITFELRAHHNLQDGWHKTFTNNHVTPSKTPNPARFGAIVIDYQCYCTFSNLYGYNTTDLDCLQFTCRFKYYCFILCSNPINSM